MASFSHLILMALPILALGAMPADAQNAPDSPQRERINFNANWRFHRGEFDDANPLGAGYAIENWRWKSGHDVSALTENTSGGDWKDAGPSDDVFGEKAGFAWFRTTLRGRDVKPLAPLNLRFASVDDNATVYLNGEIITTHEGWDQAFVVPIDKFWKPNTDNELAVLVENTEGPGGIGSAGLQIGAPLESKSTRADFDDTDWRQLNLPHDWGIEGPFDIDLPGDTGKLPWSGVGWYRKTFNLPASDQNRRIALEMDGAMSDATVWLNGQKVGGWAYGYSSWMLDLTPFVQFGAANTLAIRLNNAPQSSRWYPGGGIYRDVHLLKTAPIHVAHWGTQVTTKTEGRTTRVNAKTTLRNDSDKAQNVRLISTILDSDFKTVAKHETAVNLNAGTEQIVDENLAIDAAKLWTLQDRHRYILVSQIAQGEQILDRYNTQFGVRSIEWDAAKGFLLNGEHVYLQGVCMHHDLGALGAAWNRRAAQRQLEILQRMGANALRTSHNPPAPELLDLCDEMGILVLDEFSDTWKHAKTANGYARWFDEWAERDLRALVQRDRNHPSVIAWSTGNEIGEQGGKPADLATSNFLTNIVHQEDPTRPVATGNNHVGAGYNGFEKTVDIFGYNYKPGEYAKFHEKNPQIPLFGSETASTISSRGEYFFPFTENPDANHTDFQISSYDLSHPGWSQTPDQEFAGQDKNPFVAGEFVWTGFDYLGEPTPYNADVTNLLNYSDPAERARAAQELERLGRIKTPSRSSYFGIIDLAGFPKDRFYIYQARWRPDLPMAHILPHWNWPERVGQITPVHVYTSGDEAELFLNGQSLGRRKKGEYEYRLRWDEVEYQPGELRVVAYKNGKAWAQDTVKTTGESSKIALEADRATIANDGDDLSFVTVKITDANGLMVPRASNEIQFSLEGAGEIVATDNGNAIDLAAFSSHSRRAYNGLALVIVRAKRGQSGKMILRAKAAGLAAGEVVITAQ